MFSPSRSCSRKIDGCHDDYDCQELQADPPAHQFLAQICTLAARHCQQAHYQHSENRQHGERCEMKKSVLHHVAFKTGLPLLPGCRGCKKLFTQVAEGQARGLSEHVWLGKQRLRFELKRLCSSVIAGLRQLEQIAACSRASGVVWLIFSGA